MTSRRENTHASSADFEPNARERFFNNRCSRARYMPSSGARNSTLALSVNRSRTSAMLEVPNALKRFSNGFGGSESSKVRSRRSATLCDKPRQTQSVFSAVWHASRHCSEELNRTYESGVRNRISASAPVNCLKLFIFDRGQLPVLARFASGQHLGSTQSARENDVSFSNLSRRLNHQPRVVSPVHPTRQIWSFSIAQIASHGSPSRHVRRPNAKAHRKTFPMGRE
jgi:hypothetical protein